MKNPYLTKEYNHRPRWVSFYHQYQNIFNHKPKSVLEVGNGGGISTMILRANDIKVTTLDIDPNTNPDTIGNVLDLPYEDKSFDMAVAFETLEHLPFEDVRTALEEMARVSRRYVIFSVPDHAKSLLRLTWKLPFMKEKNFAIRIPAIDNKRFWKPCGHHWEMGNIDFPYRKVAKMIERSGLKIKSSYVPNDSAWTRYFILEKI